MLSDFKFPLNVWLKLFDFTTPHGTNAFFIDISLCILNSGERKKKRVVLGMYQLRTTQCVSWISSPISPCTLISRCCSVGAYGLQLSLSAGVCTALNLFLSSTWTCLLSLCLSSRSHCTWRMVILPGLCRSSAWSAVFLPQDHGLRLHLHLVLTATHVDFFATSCLWKWHVVLIISSNLLCCCCYFLSFRSPPHWFIKRTVNLGDVVP